jgi:hypothetical protein
MEEPHVVQAGFGIGAELGRQSGNVDIEFELLMVLIFRRAITWEDY